MNQIVKKFHFGAEGKEKLFKGIDTLAGAVASTLGAGGETVIFEDNAGVPVITKDGVTVANLCIMEDPVENMGASMVKQAAQRTVQDAGDGTTTATVLTHSLLHALVDNKDINKREVAEAINTVVDKVTVYLDKASKVVDDSMIEEVATISTNNDIELGKLIADAYRAVDLTGIVMMETSKTGETALEVVEGVEESGIEWNVERVILSCGFCRVPLGEERTEWGRDLMLFRRVGKDSKVEEAK